MKEFDVNVLSFKIRKRLGKLPAEGWVAICGGKLIGAANGREDLMPLIRKYRQDHPRIKGGIFLTDVKGPEQVDLHS